MVEEISNFGSVDLIADEEREQTLSNSDFERQELDEDIDITNEAVQEGIVAMVTSVNGRFAAIATPEEFQERILLPERQAGLNQLRNDIFTALALATGEPEVDNWEGLGVESSWIITQLEAGLVANGEYSLALLGVTGAILDAPVAQAETNLAPEADREAAAERLATLEGTAGQFADNPMSEYVAKMRLLFDAPANAESTVDQLSAFEAQMEALGVNFVILQQLQQGMSAEDFSALLANEDFAQLLEHEEADFDTDIQAVRAFLLGHFEDLEAEFSAPPEAAFVLEHRALFERFFGADRLASTFTSLEVGPTDDNYASALRLAGNLQPITGLLTVVGGHSEVDALINGDVYQAANMQERFNLIRDFAIQHSLQTSAAPEVVVETDAVPYKPSAEMAAQTTELLSFLDEFSPTLENDINHPQMRSILSAMGITAPGVSTTARQLLENPENIVQHTLGIRQADMWRQNQELIESVLDGTATDEDSARLIDVVRNFYSNLRTELTPLAQQNNLPVPQFPSLSGDVTPEVLHGEIDALIDSVSDVMRGMFSSEFEAWEAAMKAGAPRISFEDYLRANYQEGGLLSLENKLALAQFGALIADIMVMFEGFGAGIFGENTDDGPEEEPETPEETAARERAELEARARAAGVPPEVQEQTETLEAFTAYFTAEGAPTIAEFNNPEDPTSNFDPGRAAAFLRLPENAGLDLEEVQNIVDTIRSGNTDRIANALLNRGLSLEALTAIHNLPANVIASTTDTGLSLGHDGAEVAFEPASDFGARLNEALNIYNQAAEAAESERSRAAFVREIGALIVERAVSTFDENNVTFVEVGEDSLHVDNNGDSRGFVLQGNELYLDLDRVGPSVDITQADVLLMDLNSVDLTQHGFEDRDHLLTGLREAYSGKTIAEIRNA